MGETVFVVLGQYPVKSFIFCNYTVDLSSKNIPGIFKNYSNNVLSRQRT